MGAGYGGRSYFPQRRARAISRSFHGAARIRTRSARSIFKHLGKDQDQGWPKKTGTAVSERPRQDPGGTTTGTGAGRSEELLLGCEEGLYEKLDWTKLGARQVPADAVNDCGVGASCTASSSLTTATDQATAEVLADFWNVQKWRASAPCARGRWTTLEIALMADGVAPEGRVQDAPDQRRRRARRSRSSTSSRQTLVWWEKGSNRRSSPSARRDDRAYTTIRGERKGQEELPRSCEHNLYTIGLVGRHERLAEQAQAETFLVFVTDPQTRGEPAPKSPRPDGEGGHNR